MPENGELGKKADKNKPLSDGGEGSDRELLSEGDGSERGELVVLNRREEIRYVVEPIPVESLGRVLNVSRNGLMVEKSPEFQKQAEAQEQENPELRFTLFDMEMTAHAVWEDKVNMGLKLDVPLADADLKEIVAKPTDEGDGDLPALVSKELMAEYKLDELLISLIKLTAELNDPDMELATVKQYITEISEQYQKEAQEKALLAGEGGSIADELANALEAEAGAVSDENPEEKPEDLKLQLIDMANNAEIAGGVRVKDLDAAILRLGLDEVEKTSNKFLLQRMSPSPEGVSRFRDRRSFNILKMVLFSRLAKLYRYKNERGDGNSLFALEAVGLDILNKASETDIDNYYSAPTRIYSGVSRNLEKIHLGMDLLQVNKYFFEKIAKKYVGLYDGYILGHLMLNPHYDLDKDLKVSLTKKGLGFSFPVYLCFLATQFIIDGDKESGFILLSRMKRKELNEGKALNIINEIVADANRILKDLGLKTDLNSAPLPSYVFQLDKYLQRNKYSDYLLQSFRTFGRSSKRRLTLRYEDEVYSHFILGKLINARDFGMNNGSFCVVPCENVGDIKFGDLCDSFDTLVFKNVNRLPLSCRSDFARVWDRYGGRIIVTVSVEELFYTKWKNLASMVQDSIVDFPSYLSSEANHSRMIGHVIDHLIPFIGEQTIDRDPYLINKYPMDFIEKELLTSFSPLA